MEPVDEKLRIGEPFLPGVAEDVFHLRARVDGGTQLVDRADVGDERKLLDDREVLGLRGLAIVSGAPDLVCDLRPSGGQLDLGHRRGREILEQASVRARPPP